MSDLARHPGGNCFSAAGLSELLVMHNVIAMADMERAAFCAARSQDADLSVQRTGA
jgi:hypothetical protein